MLFEATKYMVICYSSDRRLIHDESGVFRLNGIAASRHEDGVRPGRLKGNAQEGPRRRVQALLDS